MHFENMPTDSDTAAQLQYRINTQRARIRQLRSKYQDVFAMLDCADFPFPVQTRQTYTAIRETLDRLAEQTRQRQMELDDIEAVHRTRTLRKHQELYSERE
jgi:hypothetical protein